MKEPSYNQIHEEVNTQRKKHKNKYSNFSNYNDVLDPLDIAINKQNQLKEELNIQNTAPSEGTTVPIISKPSINLMRNQSAAIYRNVMEIIPSDPFTFGYVKIGEIISPHGVKGELKINVETDFAESYFQPGKVIYVKKPNRLSPRPIIVSAGRKQVENIYLLSLQGIKNRLSAAVFKQYSVYIKAENRPKLNANEYLIRDLVDLKCFIAVKDENKNNIFNKEKTLALSPIGTVVGVVPPDELCDPATAALMHAMIEIKLYSKDKVKTSNNAMCLIPLVPSIVIDIDNVNKYMVIDPPAGLLDLTYAQKIRTVIRGYLPAQAIGISLEERIYLLKNIIFVN